jgi:hypothetical protein
MTNLSQIYNQIINIPYWVPLLLILWMVWKGLQILQQKSLEKFAQKKLGLDAIKLEPEKAGEKNEFLSSLDVQEQLLLNRIYSGGEKNPDGRYRQLEAKKSEPTTNAKSSSQKPSLEIVTNIGGIMAGIIGILLGIVQIGISFGLLPGKL